MVKYIPTTIAYSESGLIKDRQKFVTANDAYVSLEDAYAWRGIIKRKLGDQLLGRLRRLLVDQPLSNTVAAATYTNAGIDILTTLSLRATEPDAELECSTLVLTIDAGGPNETVVSDNGDGTLSPGAPNNLSATGGTINYITGMISVTFSAPIAAGLSVIVTFNYFPSLPVMGINIREISGINEEQTLFYDTKYAYVFITPGFQEFIPGTTWSGNNTNFFWSTNHYLTGSSRIYWVTNNRISPSFDPIRYTDGTTWTAFTPALDAGATTFLQQCLMLIPYRGRMVAFNTWEGATPGTAVNLVNRARWSWISTSGSPTDTTNGWRSDAQGYGGSLGAPTNEAIVSAAFIRDTLIVFFERSTWKFRYTGNEILPFEWERINIELGAESTFSAIRFDKGVLGVGDKGIITCDGNYVERIDDNIRDEVFRIHNGNDGVKRVHGQRDFFEQVVYWTFPDADLNPTYPNRMLLYNYDNKTWAFLRASYTVLGAFQRNTDRTWADVSGITWENASFSWDSGDNQSQFPLVVGGNQQGFVHILQQTVTNDASRHITSISTGTPPTITSTDHNFADGDIVQIDGIVGTASVLNGFRYQVVNSMDDTFQLLRKPRFAISAINIATSQITAVGNNLQVGDLVQFSGIVGTTPLNNRTATVTVAGNTFTIDMDISIFPAYISDGTAENLVAPFVDATLAGGSTYLGCGVITAINGFSMRSKKFNMINQGRKTKTGYYDILCNITDRGQVSMPIYVDYNDSQRVNPRGNDAFFNHSMNTTSTDFSTQNQTKTWHRFYCNTDSQFLQYEITLDEAQLMSRDMQGSDFALDAIILWHEVGSRLSP